MEWAYAMAFLNSLDLDNWLLRYLLIYNQLRKYPALGIRTPQPVLNELLC
jgi:hypothetical protein